jgi:hypothetical protein
MAVYVRSSSPTTPNPPYTRASCRRPPRSNHPRPSARGRQANAKHNLDYVPVKQLELADIFRDATAVIDALGWDPDINPPRTTFNVPVTRSHIEQLHHRRIDLLDTNLDLLDDIGADTTTNAIVMSEIYSNRHSVEALNRVFDAYTNTITN